MLTYGTLDGISRKQIYEAFTEAFSDYQVAVHSSYESFLTSLTRNGYSSHFSMGAFEDEKLVGFILNGERMWNGKPTIYDLGTGVIPQMRKRGITSRMLEQMKKMMEEENIDQYLLEVIQTNVSALRLYQKKGFQIQRELKCYCIEKEKIQLTQSFQIHHVDFLDLYELQDFWNCPPSWQNSNDSLNAVKDCLYYSAAFDGNKIVGYGVIHKTSGDIGQFAVSPLYRNRGIGKSLLSDLLQRTSASTVRVVNVEDNDTQLFLTHLGFDNFVDQYEMVLQKEI